MASLNRRIHSLVIRTLSHTIPDCSFPVNRLSDEARMSTRGRRMRVAAYVRDCTSGTNCAPVQVTQPFALQSEARWLINKSELVGYSLHGYCESPEPVATHLHNKLFLLVFPPPAAFYDLTKIIFLSVCRVSLKTILSKTAYTDSAGGRPIGLKGLNVLKKKMSKIQVKVSE